MYTNWTALREKRIAHHQDMNPFFFAKNKGLRADYRESACPRALELLRRTVFIATNPDWTENEVAARVAALASAARSL